jgi:predicted alpha/beta-hydrolase family hydrolase
LPQIRVPVLCINGTRDELCRRELMDSVVQTVNPAWEMHWIEHADHSFHVRKSSGRDDSQVLNEVAESAGRWLSRL